MEKDFGSWFHHQHSDRQSPNLHSVGSPFNLEQQSTSAAYMNPCANVSANGTFPLFAFSGLPHPKASQPNEPRGWFYCLPRFRQAFTPVSNSVPKEKLPACVNENYRGPGPPNAGSGRDQKRFLVFDQSGDQTTLIFSSGIGTSARCPTSWTPKPPSGYELNKEEAGTKRDIIHPSRPYLADEYNEEDKRDVGSEMHEDTEELDALLYSDDDSDYSEDDEETSTGHSPSTIVAYDKQEWLEESVEEVASSAGPIKRQKLNDGSYDVPSLMDTASSVKHDRCFEHEEDAESSCGKNGLLGELGSLSGNKRLRKEKIRETVSILKSIIPGEKGRDAIVVLDDAIRYLRTLKLKAKALGLESL